MKEQFIKHREKLLRDIDEYRMEPKDRAQVIELILKLNNEIRLLDRMDEYKNKNDTITSSILS